SLGGRPGDHGGCGERSGGARREPRSQIAARSSLLRRALGHASSVVAALAALAPRLVRLAHHDYPDGLLAMLTGAMTALVTPFRGGEVDTRALEALVEAQIAGGIDALVPCGSTGEAATLTHEEHLAVVRAVVRAARGRLPVIAGTGSNSTAEAIRL